MDHEVTPEEIERDLARTRAELNSTLSAIEHRLSPGELVDQALDYLKGGPREFAVNLGEQARDNPMPVALMAISLGWLMLSSRREPSYRYGPEYTSEGIPETGERISAHGKEAYGTVVERGKTAYGAAAESAQRMGAAIGEKREELGEKSAEKRERMGQRMSEAREGMERTSETLRHRARAMASGMRHGSEGMASGIRQTGEKARSTFSDLLSEQPLVLGALGLALGAILSAGLPTTAREREALGPYRDEAVNRAREAGREQMEKTREDLKQAVSESPTVHS
jgi:hypothetical protein